VEVDIVRGLKEKKVPLRGSLTVDEWVDVIKN